MVRRYTPRSTDKKYTVGVIDRTLGNQVLDLTDYKPNPKLQYNEGEFSGTSDNNNKANASVFIAVPESGAKEPTDDRENLYEKYESEFDGDADQFLINRGATILHSSITLTDSSGNNHTFVRRDTRNCETTYY